MLKINLSLNYYLFKIMEKSYFNRFVIENHENLLALLKLNIDLSKVLYYCIKNNTLDLDIINKDKLELLRSDAYLYVNTFFEKKIESDLFLFVCIDGYINKVKGMIDNYLHYGFKDVEIMIISLYNLFVLASEYYESNEYLKKEKEDEYLRIIQVIGYLQTV